MQPYPDLYSMVFPPGLDQRMPSAAPPAMPMGQTTTRQQGAGIDPMAMIGYSRLGQAYGPDVMNYLNAWMAPEAGATMTPSGALTSSAPEVLRSLQYPDVAALGAQESMEGANLAGMVGLGATDSGSLLGNLSGGGMGLGMLGSLGGNLVGNQIGLDSGMGSTLGGTAGGLAGGFFGGPLGALGGSFFGSLLGGGLEDLFS